MEAEARAELVEMGLHEVIAHVYTPSISDSTAAYIFSSRSSFDHYFLDNGLYLLPNQKRIAIIKVYDDGTILASKWACDKIITAQKRKNDPSNTIDQTCGTCEYSIKYEDIKDHASEVGDDYYDTMQEQLGSCSIGKTPEDQRRCKYHCDQYKPDYETIERSFKVLTINKRGKRVNTPKK